MTESINSSSVSNTPTYIATKFSNPTWVVKIGGTPITDAILQTVNLGFGSDISNAVFTLPRNPFIGVNPSVGEGVEVIVNGKTIFTGKISVRANHIGTDGLKIIYTAASNITNFNRATILKGSFNSEGSDYPLTKYSASDIMIKLGIEVTGIPNVYPGAVDITDQTELNAVESVLSKLGNYKVYESGSTLKVYQLGSGGINTRSFIIGKNVLATNLTTSIENIVDKVSIISGPGQLTVRQVIPNPIIQTSIDGRKFFVFLLLGENIGDIRVEGLTREQPKIVYDSHVFASKAILTGNIEPIVTELPEETQESLINDGVQNSTINDQFTLRPKIRSMETFKTEWTSLGASISQTPPPHKGIHGESFFTGTFIAENTAFVSLSELPKIWEARIISGQVENSDLGIEEEGSQEVEILDKFIFTPGTIRVTYTVTTPKLTVSIGSGLVTRSISDGQFRVTINTVTGEDNTATVLADMTRRAQAEYDRTHLPQTTGTISILGDETVELRQAISMGGEILDILHITHNFTNGFTTDVTVTNEKLRLNFIASQNIKSTRTVTVVDTENDRRRNSNLISQESKALKDKEQQADSEAKKQSEPPTTGPYAVFR